LTLQQVEDIHRIVVRGELDMASLPGLVAALAKEERSKADRIDVDLSGLDFIDVMGTRVLVNASRRARHAGRRLVLINPKPTIRRLFSLVAAERELELSFE
jgi:anti-sigma B factor antagonist